MQVYNLPKARYEYNILEYQGHHPGQYLSDHLGGKDQNKKHCVWHATLLRSFVKKRSVIIFRSPFTWSKMTDNTGLRESLVHSHQMTSEDRSEGQWPQEREGENKKQTKQGKQIQRGARDRDRDRDTHTRVTKGREGARHMLATPDMICRTTWPPPRCRSTSQVWPTGGAFSGSTSR